MKKYCYITRVEGKFKAVDINCLDKLETGETLYNEAISIGIIEGNDLNDIEIKAKEIMKSRFEKEK